MSDAQRAAKLKLKVAELRIKLQGARNACRKLYKIADKLGQEIETLKLAWNLERHKMYQELDQMRYGWCHTVKERDAALAEREKWKALAQAPYQDNLEP